MKGVLPKYISAAHLACSKCVYFRDDDPDIYYCERERPEFAGLCEFYEYHASTILTPLIASDTLE